MNAGEELFYTQSRLAVAGRPQLCSLTITLSNSSTAHSSNVSLFSEVNSLGIPSGGINERSSPHSDVERNIYIMKQLMKRSVV